MAKILLVDDDVDLCEIIKLWLVREEHAITIVHEGMAGFRELKSNEYDLAILDWDLPDVPGIEVLKLHREAGGVMPVIMLTGRSSSDDKISGLDGGANDYLTKPFHMKELSARIRAVLRNRAPAIPKSLGTGNEDMVSKAGLQGSTLAARYEFIEVLGQGGMGIVFRARHPHLRKFVAIKMLQSHESNPEVRARFEIEAQAASRLEHPNIASAFDFGFTEAGQPFMVMEFVEGSNLDAVLQEQDHLSVASALDIFIQLSDAMAHAHDAGVLHRDLKPSNIVLKSVPGRSPVPKILDFGCAKLRDFQESIELTRLGQAMGSPPYMSPEQVRGKPVDERSDIYSLGCVMYLSICGYAPHVGDNSQEIMIKHLEEDLVLMSDLSPELSIPVELESFVARALEKDPRNRYQSMLELKRELFRIKEMIGGGIGQR